MKNNIDLEIYIRKIMHELGFKPNLTGYEVFKDAIISILENEGKLGSVKLYKDLDKQGIEKIVHTGWGKAILKYYNIEKSEEYTEEEKQQLRELAAQVEESKKPIVREDKK